MTPRGLNESDTMETGEKNAAFFPPGPVAETAKHHLSKPWHHRLAALSYFQYHDVGAKAEGGRLEEGEST